MDFIVRAGAFIIVGVPLFVVCVEFGIDYIATGKKKDNDKKNSNEYPAGR
ncbi:hypothetical protein [Parasphaerochaeta coccoides]|nr:hypothetical protein [Parasphaerochaeta coccoides]